MIPREYLVPYLASNAIALALLGTSFRKPTWVRWATIAIFVWAAGTNARLALTYPLEYQGFGELAVLSPYRSFIYGWFRDHTAWLVVPIAVGQLTIAVLLLLNSRQSRRLAVGGAILFLLAIAPLGVGSAFPFSLTYGLALLVMARRLDHASPTPTEYPRSLPSDELVCFPLLDSGSAEDQRAAYDELRARGYAPWLVRLLRRLARIGLWYQVVAWEWGSLGLFDVLLGYSVLLMVAAPFFALAGIEWVAAVLGAGVTVLLIAALGLRLRRSSISDR